MAFDPNSLVPKEETVSQLILDRLSSPLFFSFVISFFTWNKNITLALLFYSNSTLLKLYNMDLIRYISYEFSKCGTVLIPFCIAIGYTIVSPISKEIIEFIRIKIENVSNYHKLKEHKKDPLTLEESLTLRNNSGKLKDQIEKYKIWTEINDSNLSGSWNIYISKHDTDVYGAHRGIPLDRENYIIEEINFNGNVVIWKKESYNMISFVIDEFREKLTFVLLKNNFPVYFFDLQFKKPEDYNYKIETFTEVSRIIDLSTKQIINNIKMFRTTDSPIDN